jgi:hypothetical protein
MLTGLHDFSDLIHELVLLGILLTISPSWSEETDIYDTL